MTSNSKFEYDVTQFDSYDCNISNPELLKSQELFKKKDNSIISNIETGNKIMPNKQASQSLNSHFVQNRRINHLLKNPSTVFDDIYEKHNNTFYKRNSRSSDTSINKNSSLIQLPRPRNYHISKNENKSSISMNNSKST